MLGLSDLLEVASAVVHQLPQHQGDNSQMGDGLPSSAGQHQAYHRPHRGDGPDKKEDPGGS